MMCQPEVLNQIMKSWNHEGSLRFQTTHQWNILRHGFFQLETNFSSLAPPVGVSPRSIGFARKTATHRKHCWSASLFGGRGNCGSRVVWWFSPWAFSKDPMPLKDTWVLWEQAAGRLVFFFLVPWLGWRQKKINLQKQWARKSPKDKPNICNLIRTCDLKVNVISYARCAPKNLSCASMGKNNRTAL